MRRETQNHRFCPPVQLDRYFTVELLSMMECVQCWFLRTLQGVIDPVLDVLRGRGPGRLVLAEDMLKNKQAMLEAHRWDFVSKALRAT